MERNERRNSRYAEDERSYRKEVEVMVEERKERKESKGRGRGGKRGSCLAIILTNEV